MKITKYWLATFRSIDVFRIKNMLIFKLVVGTVLLIYGELVLLLPLVGLSSLWPTNCEGISWEPKMNRPYVNLLNYEMNIKPKLWQLLANAIWENPHVFSQWTANLSCQKKNNSKRNVILLIWNTCSTKSNHVGVCWQRYPCASFFFQ